MRGMWIGAVLAVGLLAACGGSTQASAPVAAAAAPAAADDGMVLLTVTGAIGASNRGALDEFDDAFLGHKLVKFDKAFAFTRAQLAALGMHEATIKRANWPRAVKLRGPLFKDVLAAVKADGPNVVLQALDGYESTFAAAALQADSVMLAIEADGKPLPIGGHGPAWLVFPPGVVPGDDPNDDAGLAWSIFHIDVRK